MTNRHLCLSKLFQFHGFYLPKTKESRSMSISIIFIYLFKRTPESSFILSLGASWYFKSHRSPSIAFWTTLEMGIRKVLPLPYFTMELSWVTQKPPDYGLQITATKEESTSHSWFRPYGACILKEWSMAGWHLREVCSSINHRSFGAIDPGTQRSC